MEKLMNEINNKINMITFLKTMKYSKGLNSHDIIIYENAKEELKLLKKKQEELQKSKENTLSLYMSM